MLDQILAQTSLPSLHPAMVHFPIVLWVVAVALEVIALIRGDKSGGLGRIAVGFYLAGFASAVATWLSGRQAADLVGLVDAQTDVLIAQHSDGAMQTLWILGVSVAGRVVVEVLRAHIESATRLVLRLLVLVPAVIGVLMVGLTADRGGGLVYQHGVAVRQGAVIVPDKAPTPVPEIAPEPVTTASPDSVAAWEFDDDGSYVLGDRQVIELSGERMLSAPQSFGDVLLIADLDLSDFRGQVFLLHHFTSWQKYEAYTLNAKQLALVVVDEDGERRLDEVERAWPTGPVRLAVSVAGKHLKGYVDGQTVAHGHRSVAEEEGRAGLFVRGEGRIEIREIRIRPTQ
jgi:uncharacterized membrane protein